MSECILQMHSSILVARYTHGRDNPERNIEWDAWGAWGAYKNSNDSGRKRRDHSGCFSRSWRERHVTNSLPSLITWLSWNANQRWWQVVARFLHILAIRLGVAESACLACYRIKISYRIPRLGKVALTRGEGDGPNNIIPVGKHVCNR